MMRTIAILGLATLVAWMAWLTWRVEQIRYLALEACGLSYAQAEQQDLTAGRHPPIHPRECPYIDFVVPYPAPKNSN
jgi:hypothetical protein